MTEERFKLFDFKQEKVRVLHYTWIAFFLTFFVWFNMAPLKTAMVEAFDFLDGKNFKSLLLCNVALTIPARIIVGALVDRYGPRVVFSGIMIVTLIPGLLFAFGNSFTQLVISRLLLSSIGAGFVIGIKMTANWFPAKHIGRAEGFYAGWGNFGSAAAAGLIPFIGLTLLQGEMGWRWAMAISSIVTAIYGAVYYFLVKDYPDDKIPTKQEKKKGSSVMPVSSYAGLIQYLFWTIPLYAALGLLVRNLQKQQIHGKDMFSQEIMYGIFAVLAAFLIYQFVRILKFNLPRLKAGVPEEEKFPFSSVGALNMTYFANFGAELAVVSMLPFFFESTFKISPQLAGLVAGSFAVINLIARPLGGYLSDKMNSRKKTMLMYMLGISLGFGLMSLISKYGPVVDGEQTLVPMFEGTWWLVTAVIITMFCSLFVQGAEGATFAMIPSIKKEMTGRIAGMAGAYGNVGAVTYLFILSMVDSKTFFVVLAIGAAISFVWCIIALKEPEGAFGEDEGGH
ncbi:MAG: MFS transporter [Crocinitomicaceae bacterium]|nr:MFS transporter [Crocinitomicaceae bacterium]